MPLPAKLHQIPIVLEFRIRLSLQAPPRHLDIHPDVLDQARLTHVVVFRPNKAEDEQVHARAVEVLGEGVEDVDFLVVWVRGVSVLCVAGFDIRVLEVLCTGKFMSKEDVDSRAQGGKGLTTLRTVFP